MGLDKNHTRRPTVSKSRWRHISELNAIDIDISNFGYIVAFIDANNLNEKKRVRLQNGSGQCCFMEALEVKVIDGDIFYRENDEFFRKAPKVFKTQFGVFNNHNHGEFASWLERDGDAGFSEQDKRGLMQFGAKDFLIEGNYCEMFDCGEYTYAISNQMHAGLGYFKIVRLDQSLASVVLYDTEDESASAILASEGHEDKCTRLEYDGCYPNQEGWCIIASGFTEWRHEKKWEKEQYRTVLFQIDCFGNCYIRKEWNNRISTSNSLAVVGNFAYFGQNKMITRMNLQTGELSFFTNKNDVELAALSSIW